MSATPPEAEAEARRLGLALLPLRLFLGLTFLYGGIQKLADPGFFHQGAPTYIGTQLQGFARGTPGGVILRALAIPHPVLAGVGVAALEIGIGLLVTAGLLTRGAAAAGLALNLLLFLTNSWHTYPYFLGSDIVFVFAWLPLVIVGASRQPTLEPLLRKLVDRTGPVGRARRSYAPGVRTHPRLGHREADLTRRTLIGSGLTIAGVATATVGGLAFLLRGRYRPPRTLGAARSRPSRPGSPRSSAPGQSPPSTASPSRAPAPPTPPGAVKLGASSQLARGEGAVYRDPGDGNPDLIIRGPDGRLLAYSAVCTHAGCTVQYQGGQIVCPCHGATYNAQTGAVEGGPAPQGLSSRRVVERSGQIYALPA